MTVWSLKVSNLKSVTIKLNDRRLISSFGLHLGVNKPDSLEETSCMMNKIIVSLYRRMRLLVLLLCYTIADAKAAVVDTVDTYSPSMKKTIKVVVIVPDNYTGGKEFPVVYLLHGYSGNYADWIIKAKGFEKTADLYQMLIVCPDGNNSWYWDSPEDERYKYETYVSNELVNWVDNKYKTIKSRRGRAITGLSMGGHGALFLACKHQDVFGAAGSMSGGVDIRPFPNNWEMAARLGKYAEYPERWEKNTVINMLYLLTPQRTGIDHRLRYGRFLL
jgi:S-formylglutathione hydrolase FrmB